MSIQNATELQGIKRIGRVVALALKAMAEGLRPGVTTGELDEVGARVLEDHVRR